MENIANTEKPTKKSIIKKIPAIKPHLELVSAALTIPILITAILLNYFNLTKLNSSPAPNTQTKANLQTQPVNTNSSINSVTEVPIVVTATPANSNASCNSGIGPLTIVSPKENETISDNPTCIDINYQGQGYCNVVWAYRVNNGDWSSYSNNSVCLYNLPQGNIAFYLQVKSTVSSQSETIQRDFVYQNPQTATVTLSPTPTQVPTPTTISNASPTTSK